MNYFEIYVEGGQKYKKGDPVDLGTVLGYQVVERLVHDTNGGETVFFDKGAQIWIPMRRVLSIVEG